MRYIFLPMNTPTIEEIRRSNLLLLIEEAGGIAAEVARRAKTAPAHISQIVTRFERPNGNVAIIGSKLARKFEKGCGKPEGWMDVLHDTDPITTELLDIFVTLPEKKRLEVLNQARSMINTRSKRA